MGIMHNGKMYGLAYKETVHIYDNLLQQNFSVPPADLYAVLPDANPETSGSYAGLYYISNTVEQRFWNNSWWFEPTKAWVHVHDSYTKTGLTQICFVNSQGITTNHLYDPVTNASAVNYIGWIDNITDNYCYLLGYNSSNIRFADTSTYEKDKNILLWQPNGQMRLVFPHNTTVLGYNRFVPNNIVVCADSWEKCDVGGSDRSEQVSYNVYINESLYNQLESHSQTSWDDWQNFIGDKTILFDETETQWLDIPGDGKYVQLSRNGSVVGTVQYWDYNLED